MSKASPSRRIGVASLLWSASILLSRVIGLVREAALGRILGGGGEADVWRTAFVVPDFLNYLLAGGALSIVFIPMFGGYLARDQPQRGWEAFSVIANFLLVVLVTLLVGLWIELPALAHLIAPGFDDAQRATLVAITRIVLPAQLFHIVGGLLSATLQARDRHALPALAPLVYNAAIVVGGVLGAGAGGPYGFAWGVLVGSILGPFGLPLVGCLRSGMRWRPLLSLRHPDLHAYLLRSLPIMLGWSIVVLDDWILRRQGSLLGEGAIATLGYAKALMSVPMGVFGLATGVAAFPTISRLVELGDREAAYTTLASAVRRMLVLAFAAQVVFTCAGSEIARVLYGGKISAGQHAEIGRALAIFCVGLWAWAAQTIVARGFYATGNTWLPTLLGTALVPVVYPLYAALRGWFGITGLAAASTLSITAYVIVLIGVLRRRFSGVSDHYGRFAMTMVPAVCLSILAGYSARIGLAGSFKALPVVARGAAFGSIALATYVALLRALRVPEANELASLLRRRWK